jgi:pyruvate/2-oxoglutarate dehydrogenase complex dihydrolipoamide acyltransferase (E2) component
VAEQPDQIAIKIPQAGVAVTEGTIAEWFVADGGTIGAGEPLYRMETEKVEMDVDAPASGVVHILEPAGETFPVGHDIGYIAPQ